MRITHHSISNINKLTHIHNQFQQNSLYTCMYNLCLHYCILHRFCKESIRMRQQLHKKH